MLISQLKVDCMRSTDLHISLTMGLIIIIVVIWILEYYLITQSAKGGQCISQARLEGKTVLITGANTGIGWETALDLGRRGRRSIYSAMQGCQERKSCSREN